MSTLWDTQKVDGVFVAELYTEDDQAIQRLTQPSRELILERNARLRNEPETLKNLDFAGLQLTIPEIDWYILVRKYPDLKSTAQEVRRIAWQKFFASSESDPYRVRPRNLITQWAGI
jgi:hypothetical protein